METKNAKTLKNYEVKPLHWLKLGETFQLKVGGRLYIREHFLLSSKKYCCSYYEDAMKNRYFSREKLVIVIVKNR